MQTAIPKQFLPINGYPILVITLFKFLSIKQLKVILVLPQKDLDYWNLEILSKYQFLQKAQNIGNLSITIGGATRYKSVENGLALISNPNSLVAIHDGVRPFVSLDIILESFDKAKKNGSAIAAVPSKDSVRIITDGTENKALDRNKVWLVQTPQTFITSQLKKAFLKEEQSFFTDDAAVYEHDHQKIHLIDGSYKNIKITTPEDIEIAQLFLKYENLRSLQ